jgi:hypothetical protein
MGGTVQSFDITDKKTEARPHRRNSLRALFRPELNAVRELGAPTARFLQAFGDVCIDEEDLNPRVSTAEERSARCDQSSFC